MKNVTLKNKKELVYKNETANFKSKWIETKPKNKSKRVMLGGFKLECFYIFNGKQSKTFNTIKEAKQAFANDVDNLQINEKNDFHLLMIDLCNEIEMKENSKKQNKVFFSEELDDVFGLNVFKK